jgi:predicted GNAT family N-acyltransferase
VIEVRRARGQGEIDAALELRYRVFCEEQGVTLEADRDGLDDEALHLVALDGQALIGTCRLVFESDYAKLGRMAVDPSARRRGVGARMVAAAEHEARAEGAPRVRADAQVRVQSLYEKAGYTAVSEVFLDEGLPHITMEKPLA